MLPSSTHIFNEYCVCFIDVEALINTLIDCLINYGTLRHARTVVLDQSLLSMVDLIVTNRSSDVTFTHIVLSSGWDRSDQLCLSCLYGQYITHIKMVAIQYVFAK
jgi:hypothetical protein